MSLRQRIYTVFTSCRPLGGSVNRTSHAVRCRTHIPLGMEDPMRQRGRWRFVAAAVCMLVLMTTSVALAAQYEVVVTNLTRGQVFTPILVATHKPGMTLFTLGGAASVELEVLAEGGDTAPLAALLRARPDVLDVTDSGAPLPAGGSVTVTVRTTAQFDHVSVAAMLVPTNDAFFGIN